MQIVTVANAAPKADYYCFREMLASCRRFGHEPLILGWGQPWGGLGNKPRLLLKSIESGQITDDHILFLDAFDTVLARPPCDIMAAYAEYDAPIVWGAERNLFPDIGCDRDAVFPDALGGFRYLNSGVCVAQTDAMLAYLQHIDAANIPDDHKSADGARDINPNDQEIALKAFVRQFTWTDISEKQPMCPRMALDTECRIALNMHSVTPDEIDVSGERIKVLATGAEPCIFHANGNAKDSGMLALVLAKLGY
jgi:hypothetical protein